MGVKNSELLTAVQELEKAVMENPAVVPIIAQKITDLCAKLKKELTTAD